MTGKHHKKHAPHAPKNDKSSGRWKSAAKIAFVVGGFYFLVKKGLVSVSLSDTHRAILNWEVSAPAFAAMTLTTALGVVRWQWLLRAQGIRLPWSRVTQLTLIGMFFNIALPGAVSGDFVKAFYIGREIQGQRARAFGSILFDRVAGLSALVLVSATSLAAGLEQFWGTALFNSIEVMILIAAVAVVGFYGYLFLVRERHDPVLRLLRRIVHKHPRAGSLERIYVSLRHYHNHRAEVMRVLLLSVVIHLIVGWACRAFAFSMGDDLAMLPVYVVTPLGLLFTAIPVLPAGIGTGHVAFSFLFKLIGSAHGADIYTMFAIANIGVGLVGGLVYLRFRTHEPKPVFDRIGAEA
jgi:uncharacterized protein (TIRG00374 family)